MASISTTIQLYDKVSAPINNMISALDNMCGAYEKIEKRIGSGFDVSSIETARQAIASASRQIADLGEGVEIPVNTDIPNPVVPEPAPIEVPVDPDVPSPIVTDVPEPVEIPIEWQADNMEVFTSSGVERFEQEIQSANSLMQTLQMNQERVQQSASKMDILPDNAVNDINGISARLTSLRGRLTQLEKTPVSLRTTEVNNQIEHLRSQLVSAIESQNDLNKALDNMDASAANTAYIQLSQTISGTERYIRNNEDGQQDFNEAINRGTQQSEQLMNTVKKAVAAFFSIQAIKETIDLSDELTQTKARLNLMNDGLQTTDELVNMVYAASQNARGSFGDMAALVAKFGNNARDAFKCSEEVVAFTNLVQKEMVIAGTSSTEASNAMLQLAQALGSGVLRGDELRSIFEQAPNLIQAIADYMGKPIGKIRDMAADGEITASIVKSAIFAAADDINAKFEQMPMTWNQIWTNMKNGALMQFQPVLQKINELANNPSFQTFAANAVSALANLVNILLNIFELVSIVGNFISEHWSVIAPIIGGIAAALGLYNAALLISAGIQTVSAIAKGFHAIFTKAEATATTEATVAQTGLNAAMQACPIVWIIDLILFFIVIIYAVCAAIAHATGVADSGFGMICGGVNVVIQFFKNLGLTVANIAVGIGMAIAALGSNIMTAFHNAICSVQSWWYDLLSTCLSVIESICQALNKLPFVEFDYSGISSAANEYAAKASEAAGNKEDYKSIGDAFNNGMSTFDTFQDGWASKAYKSGASWGDGVANKVSGLFNGNSKIDTSNMFNGGGYNYSAGYDASQVPSNIADTASNTGKAADSLDITSEDLKYLRDIAEKETINRFTTAKIKVEMNNNNNISNDMDLDGIVDYLATGVNDAMEKAAEGVHV